MRRYYGHYQLERESAGIRVAALEATVPAEEVLEHTHDEAHLILVTHGHYVSSARDMPDVSRGPIVLFNPPGTTHRDRFAAVGGRFMSISVPAAVWAGVEDKAPGSRGAHRLGVRALAAAYRLRAELTRWDFASPLEHEADCYALLEEVSRTPPASPSPPKWLSRIREQLRDQDRPPPSLHALALDAGVHPVHASRAFRRHFGCTPGAYLRQARLEHAVELMARGASLAEAACGSGFHDQSHFNRTLRSAAGLTPDTLRRLMRALDGNAWQVECVQDSSATDR
jgi:AraC family transcriptional regulator